jgi:hypothetical protein
VREAVTNGEQQAAAPARHRRSHRLPDSQSFSLARVRVEQVDASPHDVDRDQSAGGVIPQRPFTQLVPRIERDLDFVDGLHSSLPAFLTTL